MILQFALLLTTFTSVPAVTSAWGGDGHRLVCEITWRHLTPEARALVQRLRNGENGTFAESCTWADEVRGERPETYSYHFINIPTGTSGMHAGRDCGDPAKRCAPWAIKHYAVILADNARPPSARLEALKFLGHFVGDLHQPLHAGRPEDLGGNRIMVSFFGDRGTAEHPMQLHSVWDSGVLRRARLRWPDSAGDLMAGISTADVAAWTNSDVVSWTNESYRIAEEFVYTATDGSNVADAYYLRALPIAKQRIRQAGIRLAHLLNEAARGRTSFNF
jgi:hypothetical protein